MRQIRAGQQQRARADLSSAIELAGDSFDAHWLLATSYLQTDEVAEALPELYTCVRLRPDNLEALTRLGDTLSRAGKVVGAERALRKAIRLHPTAVPAACALGRLLLTHNRAADALKVLDVVAAYTPVQGQLSLELLMLRGHAQMALGRPADAAGTFRRWLALDPNNTDARLRLAAALADDLHAREAEAEVRRCMQAGLRSANALFILGRALMGQRRYAEAEDCFRNAVRTRPDFITAQTNLSEVVWMRTADVHAASTVLDAALAHPAVAATPLRIAKARLWLAARDPRRALAAVEAGLSGANQDPVLLRAAANIALQFDGVLAVGYAQRAVQLMPDDWGALSAYGNAALAVGDSNRALVIAERLCAREPDNGEALAMRADSLRSAGDERYRAILDYTAFVHIYRLSVPPGWPDLPSYLADLACDLDALHVARAHPVENSLRGDGSQAVLNPSTSSSAAVRAFPIAIDDAIQRYMQAIGTGPDPMRRRNTGHYRLNGMWSVRLRTSGFHTNHYHPKGWISSACYVRVPPAVAAQRGEGWLKFGEPAFPTTPPLGPEYFLRPEPGLLALFPAYLWHGTVPFTGAPGDTRLTIAFDVLPGGDH